MRRALISDIHGNLEALEAVLENIETRDVAEIVCLGDIIGYGPNPRECIDLVIEHCEWSIMGNHDYAAMYNPEGFSDSAEKAIFWTRELLENPYDRKNEQRWEFLNELSRAKQEELCLFVHGSARNPLSEYVFPEDIYNPRKMERLFQIIDRFCFQGHTHYPGIFTENSQFLAADDIRGPHLFDDGKAMINVGSVGQPRDNNPRACYAVFDDGPNRQGPFQLSFHRVSYDIETTVQKIYEIPSLNNFLGDRLRTGR